MTMSAFEAELREAFRSCWLPHETAAPDGRAGDLRHAWVALPVEQRQPWAAALDAVDARVLKFDWLFHARPEQLAPAGDWFTWFIKAGRGWGKTRTGAEWIRGRVESGAAKFIALVAKTPADARDVMVEGESGIMAISPPWNRPRFEPANRRLVWPSGARATIYSDEVPGQLRGPQHDTAWVDELAKYRNPQDTWDNLSFGLRLGTNPQSCVTTTPTPIPIVRQLLRDPKTVVTGGSTYDNVANLAPAFIEMIRARYENTRLGRQELYADVVEQAEGALWQRDVLEELRVQVLPPLRRIVIAIDPAATSAKESDETGIVVAGLGEDHHGYVLDDLSGQFTPDGWARRAVNAFKTQKADRIVAEVNNGGEMVEHTVRTVDKNVPYKAVHASRGKRTRAEPVAALYEQRKVHHVGYLGELETQMCTWRATDGEPSPDRVDALVWALTELLVTPSTQVRVW